MSAVPEAIISTRNENVTNYVVGSFNDGRLLKVGALLFKKIINNMSTKIKKLAMNRAEQMAFSRFLSNKKTTTDEIEDSIAQKTNENSINKKHVLCINDTVEVNYSSQSDKKSKFGVNRNKKKSDKEPVKGFLSHPGLIVNAENNDILGLSSIKVWTRQEAELEDKRSRPIEEKESYKWVEAAEKAKNNITNADMLTIIGDRESDIYELFDRVPDNKTHIITRSMHNRKLITGVTIGGHMEKVLPTNRYKIDLPPVTGKRKARKATIAIKYSNIEIKAPHDTKSDINNDSIKLTCIEAEEINFEAKDEKPIFWRLLTTHKVNTAKEAKQIILWYSWRWNVEQVFRTMKKKGLKIEECEVAEPEALFKMFILALAAAVKILCLVNARDGNTDRQASDIFSDEEILVLAAALLKVNGRTKKQQNSHKYGTLSWASWIIARLGNWNGYACESPPGPITMYDGLDKFMNYVEGWKLAQKDVCIG